MPVLKHIEKSLWRMSIATSFFNTSVGISSILALFPFLAWEIAFLTSFREISELKSKFVYESRSLCETFDVTLTGLSKFLKLFFHVSRTVSLSRVMCPLISTSNSICLRLSFPIPTFLIVFQNYGELFLSKLSMSNCIWNQYCLFVRCTVWSNVFLRDKY